MPSVSKNSFTSFFPSWLPFISFACLAAMARTSRTMLDRKEQTSSPCSQLWRKIQPFTIKYFVGYWFFIDDLLQVLSSMSKWALDSVKNLSASTEIMHSSFARTEMIISHRNETHMAPGIPDSEWLTFRLPSWKWIEIILPKHAAVPDKAFLSSTPTTRDSEITPTHPEAREETHTNNNDDNNNNCVGFFFWQFK